MKIHKEKLDLGCGINKIKGTFGIDISPNSDCDLMWNLNKGLPMIKSNSVKVIYCIHTIEHIKNVEFLLKECYRVLKKGGKLIIETPNRKSLINRLFHSYHRPIIGHVNLFSKDELARILRIAGFKNIKIELTPLPKYRFVNSFPRLISGILRYYLSKILPPHLRENIQVVTIKKQ
jgi:SAM-dependent methyltransferase